MNLKSNKYFLSLFIAFTLTLAGLRSFSQSNEKYHVAITTHYGYVIPHRPYMQVFNKYHIPVIEASFSKKLFGPPSWRPNFLNPEAGVSFMMMDLGNPQVLGNGYSLFWFFDLPLLNSEKLQYSLKVGQGFGYVEKKFDTETNFKNFANSTNFNGFVLLSNHLRIPITNQINTSIGISFIHFSNGGFNKPNLGLNIPAVNLGFDYKIGRAKTDSSSFTKSKKKGHFSDITLSWAVKERRPAQNNNYVVFSLNYTNSYSKNGISYWGYGLDAIYDEAMRKELNKLGKDGSSFDRKLRMGIHLSYILKVGAVQYIIQPGFYLYSPYDGDGFMYHRIGTRYQFSRKFGINATLRTHFAVANHFEFGITYKL